MEIIFTPDEMPELGGWACHVEIGKEGMTMVMRLCPEGQGVYYEVIVMADDEDFEDTFTFSDDEDGDQVQEFLMWHLEWVRDELLVA